MCSSPATTSCRPILSSKRERRASTVGCGGRSSGGGGTLGVSFGDSPGPRSSASSPFLKSLIDKDREQGRGNREIPAPSAQSLFPTYPSPNFSSRSQLRVASPSRLFPIPYSRPSRLPIVRPGDRARRKQATRTVLVRRVAEGGRDQVY